MGKYRSPLRRGTKTAAGVKGISLLYPNWERLHSKRRRKDEKSRLRRDPPGVR